MPSTIYSKLFSILVILIIPLRIIGQVDSTYIRSFEQDFFAKTYVVEKFTMFDKMNDNDKNKEFSYRTNNPINLGLGITWKDFTLSFGYGFDFFRNKNKGKTNSLEFQHHWYGRKFMYDFFLQQHKGFYNDRRNKDKSYTLYPDIKTNLYGGSLHYVFNNKKFSYKAAFNQTEKQLKSAGSLLVGISLYYSKVVTDTTVLFERMAKNNENLQFGISGGYAYTWVINKHWFATGAASMGISMGNNQPKYFFKEKMEVYPSVNGRFALGYNANSWSLGASSLFNVVYLYYDREESLSMNNLNFQLTFIKRFDWNNIFVNKTLNKTHNAVNKTKSRLGI